MVAGGFDDYLTAKEVSRMFRVHWKTLCRWGEQGKFPKPIKVEGELRWIAFEVQLHQHKLRQERETQNILPPEAGPDGAQGDSRDILPEGASSRLKGKPPKS